MRPLYFEQPTHPNLEQVLNSAGFYRRREWEGLTDDFCYIEGSREAERISIPPTPQPCPTCVALSRTVMLDQTAHDTKREWVGLTDEEIHDTPGYRETREMYRFAKAIEAKLKDKNT
jgi:hypothetical protein